MAGSSRARIALYARISLDRRDGEGVARQLADCREVVAKRWPKAEVLEFVDNDISAFRRRRRPKYDRLIAELQAGQLTAVVAYHPDRLYRRLTDLEAFIDAVGVTGTEVVTVKAGDVDFSSASGRMIAGILGAVSKHESERMGERVARAMRERAVQGRHAGGGIRAFGLTADRTALVPLEADELRRTAANLLVGATWGTEVRRLNAAGIRNSTGNQWYVGQLRRTITSPHVAGLRTYHGEIVGDAEWPAILDRDTWDLLRADAAQRRRGRPPSDRHLLTGLLACSRCGRNLLANRRRHLPGGYVYRCAPVATTTGRGCGGISIAADRAEDHVTSVVGSWLDDPIFLGELDAYVAYGDASLAGAQAELDEIERRQAHLDTQWSTGDIDDTRFDRMSATLAGRRTDVEARILGAPRHARITITSADMRAGWDGLTLPERREAIRLLAHTPIIITPATTPDRQRLQPEERITLRPAWED